MPKTSCGDKNKKTSLLKRCWTKTMRKNWKSLYFITIRCLLLHWYYSCLWLYATLMCSTLFSKAVIFFCSCFAFVPNSPCVSVQIWIQFCIFTWASTLCMAIFFVVVFGFVQILRKTWFTLLLSAFSLTEKSVDLRQG